MFKLIRHQSKMTRGRWTRPPWLFISNISEENKNKNEKFKILKKLGKEKPRAQSQFDFIRK